MAVPVFHLAVGQRLLVTGKGRWHDVLRYSGTSYKKIWDEWLPSLSTIPPYHPLSLSFTLLPVFSMEEEREQPSKNRGRHGNYHNSSIPETRTLSFADNLAIHRHQPLPDQPHDFGPISGAGTYIVQVPKDQVFRVPSPQNAAHLGRQDDSRRPQKGRGSCCCSRCMCLCSLVAVIVLIIAIIGVIINIFVGFDDPSFQIERLMYNKPHSEFDIRLKVGNPNKHKSISYDQDSNVSLSFKQKKIAHGKFQNFDQDPGNSTAIPIVLHGSKLPAEIETSMNSKKSKIRIPLFLSIDLGLELKVGAFHVQSKRIQVSCSLTVDKLEKNTHIWAQDCGTKS
ncbi:NDR1/HIN1-like protein 13 [Coffea arabica]|uniref:NDR1/HIN1-like protein 13 n=1 Tax=Coffea arabica TaxID=13443 RepID=A0A6P6UWW9_COFAR|nr:NDR1/HIN1-like protein 13 [Coffea arabica]